MFSMDSRSFRGIHDNTHYIYGVSAKVADKNTSILFDIMIRCRCSVAVVVSLLLITTLYSESCLDTVKDSHFEIPKT